MNIVQMKLSNFVYALLSREMFHLISSGRGGYLIISNHPSYLLKKIFLYSWINMIPIIGCQFTPPMWMYQHTILKKFCIICIWWMTLEIAFFSHLRITCFVVLTESQWCNVNFHEYAVKPVLRGHIGTNQKWSSKTGDLLKEVQFIRNFLLWDCKRVAF